MKTKINVSNLTFAYGNHNVLKDCSFSCREHTISAITGPSGIGKSTFLSIINRLWESIPECSMDGSVKIHFDNEDIDIYSKKLPPHELRKKVGTIFQVPNPLPVSIYKNIAFPLKLHGEKKRDTIEEAVERSLKRVFLWDEVKDRLTKNALDLSGGQQQRLCIARALMLNPEILLFDEPTSSLDEESRIQIEELLLSLKDSSTIVMISHYFDQVKRVADRVFELSEGKLIEI